MLGDDQEIDYEVERIGLALADARRASGLSQRKLSEITGIGPSTIGNFEAGRRDMTLWKVLKLMRAVGADPGQVFGVRFVEEVRRPGRGGGKMTHAFSPDWCIAPGETLREWMKDNGVGADLFAAMWPPGTSHRDAAERMVNDVLERKPLTDDHAAVLERATGISARFWNARERRYRADLAAGLKDVSDDE